MIIKKLSLRNIRSYKEQEIQFSEGKTLLSGDIGAGKSTLLLALEFALFGLQKGILEGNALLRNGEKEGKIEIILDINGIEYMISRSLKRDSKGAISQENCFLSFNGIKKELSTKELKTFVIEILGYPPQLITKQNLVYRYTVYTPQEEMKKILLEDKEERIDTLRKVFDIDKYKRILNASEIFISKIKEKKKEKEGQVLDFPIKKEALELKKQKVEEIREKFTKSRLNLALVEQELIKKKNELEKIEGKIKELNEIKETISSNESSIREKKISLNEKINDSKDLEDGISILKSQISQEEIKEVEQDIDKKIKEKEIEFERLDKEKRTFELNSAAIKSKNDDLRDHLKKISELKTCPVCEQIVDENHKEKISSEIENKTKSYTIAIESNINQINQTQMKIEELQKEIKSLREKEKKQDLNKFKILNLQEKEKKMILLKNQIEIFKKDIFDLEKKLSENKEKTKNFLELEELYSKIKKEIKEIENEEKMVLVEKTSLERQSIDLEREIKELEKEILSKEKTFLEIQTIQKLQDFLNKNFYEIITNMEKQVMLKLSYEFNSLFKNWSSKLIENENMQARVDEEFSPMIEQAGHDINYKYLSGGERTALALAYRLALNQVINSMLTGIKTRELLILDEPTDGFSSKQLEKMREVLNEITANQVIIVSHEQQIENFVEKVIFLKKEEGHETKIL